MRQEEEPGTDFLESYLYFLEQRAYPGDSLDIDAYARARRHRDRMPAARRHGVGDIGATTLDSNWEFAGPKDLPPPYRIYNGQGPISGRVNVIAFDPNAPGSLYLGAAGGGLWHSTDNGVTWEVLSDGWPAIQVSSIAIDPVNSGTIYVGTGDFDGYGGLGFGVMKTTDGGVTWNVIGNREFGRFAVSAVCIDPDSSQNLLVAAGRPRDWWTYLWRSTDGGATWYSPLTVYAHWRSIQASLPDITGSRYLYAVGLQNGGQVYRSSDHGATWTKLSPPLSNVNWYDHTSLDIAVSSVDPRTVYLLCGFDRKIWKSPDAGITWIDITAGFPGGSNGYNWSQSDYDSRILCTAATDPDTGMLRDALYVSLIDVVLSPDGGATWKSFGGPTYTDSALTHNDQHALAFDPNDPFGLLVGNDGGLYRYSHDPATGDGVWSSLNSGLALTQFYKTAFHPTDPNRVLGGTQDNSTPALLGTATWKNVGGGDGGFCAISAVNPDIQYATSQNLFVYRTQDNWATSQVISPNIGSDNKAFITPIVLDPNDFNSLYAGTNYLWRWSETTRTWTPRLGGRRLSDSGYLLCVAVARGDSNRIYTGSVQGELWMTADAGTTWTRIDGGTTPLPSRAITSIDVDPVNPDRLLVGLSGTATAHMWRCDNARDGARRWINVSGSGETGLPDVPLNAIARDPGDPQNTFYVGTDIGVFATSNGGDAWTNATGPLGLPNVPVNDLKAVQGTGFLYAATFGRGLWRARLAP